MVAVRPPPYRGGVLTDLLAPWRRATTWWTVVHLLLDGIVGCLAFAITFGLLVPSIALLVVLPLALPVVWALFAASHLLAHVERSRAAALLGVELVDPVPPVVAPTWLGRLRERVRSRHRWREVGHHLLALPLGVFTMVVTAVAWGGSVALVGLPLYRVVLPDDTARFGLFAIGSTAGALAACVVGVLGLVVVAPWLSLGLGRLDAMVARWLLGGDELAALEAEVARLEHRRVAAVDSAEQERRRIERDLHDGAQQRLVALAMDLGAARQRLEHDPDGGRALVASAHEEAKAALAEIRALVRGIHPVILEDRGLDAALSAVVARSPVPVSLAVDVAERPSPAVESTTYFVVSEALTNVARHAHATRASVTIVRRGERLVVEVSDDGVGGADPAGGTGLAGLAERVAAHDGWLQVLSPAGGPTTVLVELPCAS
jgi:signal transduction histidine kinase